ncbi:Bromodomain-containing protein [Phyllosticta citricarpa]|uniref:Bromodomain-containing protein n=2 Tax=Phyllosticta TaxID=121621 RepID=A0ABR1MDK1_9PEZI
MESASKRKASAAGSPESEGRASKRQRMPVSAYVATPSLASRVEAGAEHGDEQRSGPNDVPGRDADAERETPETTFDKGIKFVETMRAAKDKNGRLIATNFLELPDRDSIPEYYEEIKLPIAFSTIEAKLHNREYSSLAELEGDVKRMVHNAKQFNDKKSAVYEDAERIRKTASNFMVKHNPAYKNPSYTAVATPIPGEDATNGHQLTAKRQLSERPKRAAAATAPHPEPEPESQPDPTPSKTRHSERHASPAKEPEKAETGETDFTGKNFQEAQELLIKEFIEYVEPDSGLPIYQPFVHLPSRSLKEYYSAIKNPMSLDRVLKKVQGFIGRSVGFSGISEFKTWHQLEECVSLIWRNAREFNEDGSDIFNLANEFEEHFKQRLEDAKEKVKEPAKTTLRLNMNAQQQKPSGIKLRLGGNKSSPAPGSAPDTPVGRSSATPGVIVDNEALERQQRQVQAGLNGQRPSSSGGQGALTARSGSAASPAPNGVKSETQPGQSPALETIRPSSIAPDSRPSTSQLTASMPPPNSATPRPPSASPYANGHAPMQQSHSHMGTPYHPANGYDNKYRQPGKSVADALLPNIIINTHPQLNVPRPFRFNIPASPKLAQQSVTISLPGSHTSIQIQPHVPVALTQRPWRIFVTVNNTRINQVTNLETRGEKGRPVYEARMQPGVNRVDIEVIAATGSAGKPKSEGVEIEKCTIFVNLMRP